MIPTVLNQNQEEINLINVKKVKLRRGGREYLETLPWYSADGKDWFVEVAKIQDYIKGNESHE